MKPSLCRALVTLVILAVGCATTPPKVEVIRGPTIREKQRENVEANAGTVVEARASWPEVELAFSRFDLCTQENVRFFIRETLIGEDSPVAQAATKLGWTELLVGAGLFVAQGLFSTVPDTSRIDSSGHYVAAPRQQVRVWSFTLMGLAVPSFVVGAFGGEGQVRRIEKASEVTGRTVSRCHLEPASGWAEPGNAEGAPPTRWELGDGKLVLSASELGGFDLEKWTVEGRQATVPEETLAVLRAFAACRALLGQSPLAEPGKLETARIQEELVLAERCLPLGVGEAALRKAALESELEGR